ncbi:MAG: PQQ-binding-like beta-propeller repeat protein [Pirellulales bacterium]|nr:PQQ-binding-like beta-propeller repeat protein [Pirellulales bacterium]
MQRISIYIIAATISFLSCNPYVALADDWPQWRGPNRDGKSMETGLLQTWPDNGPSIKWKCTQIGAGYASLVVGNGLIHTIGNESNVIYAYGIDENTGELLWKTKIGESTRHAMSTPTLDGAHLYALDPDGDLVCLNASDGKKVWGVSFDTAFSGKLQSGRGYGESPLVDGRHLICTPGGDDAMIVALEKTTGELVWSTPAPKLGNKGGDGASFSSIIKSRIGNIDQYVQLIGRGLVGVAADDGRFLWGYNDICADIVNIPTPIAKGNFVFSANGYNAGSVLLELQPDQENGINATEIYRLNGNTFQNHHGGVIELNNHIYGGHGSNNGLPTCLKLENGKINWKRRGPGVGSASVIYADNRFVFRYQNGVVALIEANTEGFSVRGKWQIPGAGGDSWSHPVIANKTLLLREQGNIHALSVGKGSLSGVARRVNMPDALPVTMATTLRENEIGHQSLAVQHADDDDNKPLIYHSYLYDVPDIKSTLTTPFVTLKGGATTPFDPNALEILTKIETPFVLNLTGVKVTARSFIQLAGIKSLYGLDLQFCTGLDSDALKAVSQLNHLRTLNMAGSDVTDDALQHLASSKTLRALDLEICEQISDASMSHISRISQLQFLDLKKTAFEKLKITDQALILLSPLQSLEYLNLYGNRVSDNGMVHVAKLENLQFLDLSLVGITDKGVQALQPLSNLRSLKLLYNPGFAGPTLTDACMSTLADFKRLNHLNIVGANVTSVSTETFKSLKRLTQLEVQYTGFSASDIEQIQTYLPNTLIVK